MAKVSDVREASRKDKERVAVQKRESSRQTMDKGLGVTFYKQGMTGPLSTTPPAKKKSSPKATVKREVIQGDRKRLLERGFSPRDAANVKSVLPNISRNPYESGRKTKPGEDVVASSEAERRIKKRTFWQKLNAGGLRETFKRY